MISIPRSFSSSRIRSASAQFFAFFASVRAATSASISGSAEAAASSACFLFSASADPEIDALVAARTEAKKAKNWAEADRIRDELKARGIEIIDTPQGAKWRKV